MESTLSAVIPGTSRACWRRMVVSLGGRKLKLWPSLMLLEHHVLHWWAMKKYKRGQMSTLTADWSHFEIATSFCRNFVPPCIPTFQGTGYFGGLKDCQIHAYPKNRFENSISTEFTAAFSTAKAKWLTGYAVMTMWFEVEEQAKDVVSFLFEKLIIPKTRPLAVPFNCSLCYWSNDPWI